MINQISVLLLLAVATTVISQYPDSLDWRQNGVIANVKDQQWHICGSCYTFAACGVLEAHYQIRTKNWSNISFSEQEILECYPNPHPNPQGPCFGGAGELDVLHWIGQVQGGLYLESSYPYVAPTLNAAGAPTINACHSSNMPSGDFVKLNFTTGGSYMTTLPYNVYNQTMEALMVQQLQNGPIAFNMMGSTGFGSTKAGEIYSDALKQCDPSNTTGHWMTMYGYDSQSWLVKNSWGPGFADNGFVRIARGSNICGIYNKVFWPIWS